MQDEYVYIDNEGKEVAPATAQSPNNIPYSYPPTSTVKTDKADLLDKIRPDAIVETIRHKLMGEELLNGSWIKIEELQDRAISKKGAWDICNLMLSVSSQNVSLSKLTNNEIRQRTLAVIKTLRKMILKNWKEYGINGSDQIFFIKEIVMSNTFITLKQPEGGGIRALIKGTTSESIVHNQSLDTKTKWGVFGRR